MASYFSEAGNLNGSDANMCSDVSGSSSSGFQIGQMKLLFYYFPHF